MRACLRPASEAFPSEVTTRGRGLNENPLDRRAGFDWVSNAAVKVMREFKKPFGGTNFYTQAINQRS